MMELSFLLAVVIVSNKRGLQINWGAIIDLWSVLLLIAFVVVYIADWVRFVDASRRMRMLRSAPKLTSINKKSYRAYRRSLHREYMGTGCYISVLTLIPVLFEAFLSSGIACTIGMRYFIILLCSGLVCLNYAFLRRRTRSIWHPRKIILGFLMCRRNVQ